MLRRMRLLMLLSGFCVLASCGKDDKRDDSVLNVPDITGKYWYYNQWRGDKDSYLKDDVLEVLKFEKNGELIVLDLSGRKENVVGKWRSSGNEIDLMYNGRDSVIWDVLRSGENYISAVINGQGTREYTTDGDWLGNLTADAFLVNEYTDGNRYKTHVGAYIQGNMNVREANLIPAAETVIPMRNQGYYWCEQPAGKGDYIDFDGKRRDVRFYVRIGGDGNLKLKDSIFEGNIPERPLADVQLKAQNPQGISTLTVEWNPYSQGDIYYRVEIFDGNMDLIRPYFISRMQTPGSRQIVIRNNTAGDINRMSEIKPGEKYIVRLAAVLFEPGTDVVNDEYSYANMQAVTYVTKSLIWD